MAYPSTELNNLRNVTTRILNQGVPDLAEAIALIDGSGTDDTERTAFFTQAIEVDEGNDDITSADWIAAGLALRQLQAAYDVALPALYKLRR